MPTKKHSGEVEITRNGAKTIVWVARPDLGTGGRSKAPVAPKGVVAQAVAAPATTFSVKAIEKRDQDAVFA
jgi:hypothetical protein